MEIINYLEYQIQTIQIKEEIPDKNTIVFQIT